MILCNNCIHQTMGILLKIFLLKQALLTSLQVNWLKTRKQPKRQRLDRQAVSFKTGIGSHAPTNDQVNAQAVMRFNENPVFCPEPIDNFYQNVNSKMTFLGNIRITGLISLLDADAKRTIQLAGLSGLLYESALKTLKRDFGNPLLLQHCAFNGFSANHN